MTSNSPKLLALLFAGSALAIWLLFFVGPELFDMHSTLGLIGALVIYLGAPFALFYAYRFARTTKGKSND